MSKLSQPLALALVAIVMSSSFGLAWVVATYEYPVRIREPLEISEEPPSGTSLDLWPGQSTTVDFGITNISDEVTYRVVITHEISGGISPDYVTVEYVPDDSAVIGPGETVVITASVEVDYEAPPGEGTINFSVDRLAPPGVEYGVEVSVSPAYQNGAPDTSIDYTMMVRNTGTVADTYELTATDTEGWTLTLDPETLELEGGELGTATLSVAIPESAEECTEDDITVTATSAEASDSASCTAHATLEEVAPTVTTEEATGVTTNSATLNANFTVGTYSPVEVWFEYDATTTTHVTKTASGAHSETVTGLTPETTYEFRAALEYDATTIYGDWLEFTTLPEEAPPEIPQWVSAHADEGSYMDVTLVTYEALLPPYDIVIENPDVDMESKISMVMELGEPVDGVSSVTIPAESFSADPLFIAHVTEPLEMYVWFVLLLEEDGTGELAVEDDRLDVDYSAILMGDSGTYEIVETIGDGDPDPAGSAWARMDITLKAYAGVSETELGEEPLLMATVPLPMYYTTGFSELTVVDETPYPPESTESLDGAYKSATGEPFDMTTYEGTQVATTGVLDVYAMLMGMIPSYNDSIAVNVLELVPVEVGPSW